MDCTHWKPQIDKAVATYGRRLPTEARDDMRQDCYMALIEKVDKVNAVLSEQGLDSAGKYVYRIAANRCISALRENKRHSQVFSCNPLAPEEYTGEEQELPNVTLDAAISRLPTEEQFVINALYFNGSTERETGAQVGRSQRWARTRKKRALGKLRASLTERKES